MTAGVSRGEPAVGRRSSGPGWLTDLKYRFPGRYMASWAALGLLVVVTAFAWPASLHGSSILVVSALAGVLALAAFGQMLVIMIGGIDLSVPAILAEMWVEIRSSHPNDATRRKQAARLPKRRAIGSAP